MLKLFKKSRLILAVTLLSQAVTLFFLFILQAAKRKSLAAAFLAVSSFEIAAGSYLLLQLRAEERERQLSEQQAKEMRANPDTFTIPLDEQASEKDFR
jgi:hypothetical protein